MADTFALGRLSDTLDFATVPDLWPVLAERIGRSPSLRVSLEGVKKTNSAALALLLEGLELAARRGCRLSYVDLPEELLELARVSNVEEILVGREGAPAPG